VRPPLDSDCDRTLNHVIEEDCDRTLNRVIEGAASTSSAQEHNIDFKWSLLSVRTADFVGGICNGHGDFAASMMTQRQHDDQVAQRSALGMLISQKILEGGMNQGGVVGLRLARFGSSFCWGSSAGRRRSNQALVETRRCAAVYDGLWPWMTHWSSWLRCPPTIFTGLWEGVLHPGKEERSNMCGRNTTLRMYESGMASEPA
jgi:hypothetical protein